MILHGNFGQEAPYNSVHNSRKNQNCAKCKVLFYEGNERNEGNPENVWYTLWRDVVISGNLKFRSFGTFGSATYLLITRATRPKIINSADSKSNSNRRKHSSIAEKLAQVCVPYHAQSGHAGSNRNGSRNTHPFPKSFHMTTNRPRTHQVYYPYQSQPRPPSPVTPPTEQRNET
jgi:hypothetical protein